jgi:hypothetical protein
MELVEIDVNVQTGHNPGARILRTYDVKVFEDENMDEALAELQDQTAIWEGDEPVEFDIDTSVWQKNEIEVVSEIVLYNYSKLRPLDNLRSGVAMAVVDNLFELCPPDNAEEMAWELYQKMRERNSSDE